MGIEVNRHEFETLKSFFEAIFQDEEGVLGLAFIKPTSDKEKSVIRKYFNWPEQREQVLGSVLSNRDHYDVYFCPSLFLEIKTKEGGLKENIKGSRCFWVDFDGNSPDWSTIIDIPQPSIIIQSSTEDRTHCYWLSEAFNDPETIESINRRVAYGLKSDSSGWDCNQLLRPPCTYNHKRERHTRLIRNTGEFVDPIRFEVFPEPTDVQASSVAIEEALPAVEGVIFKYAIPDRARNLFLNGRPDSDRSTALVELGYCFAELGCKPEEIMSVLLSADKRWGKFSERKDGQQRLDEILAKVISKHPVSATNERVLESLGLRSLLATEVELEWVWDDRLQKGGYFLLTGPPAVGKTQLSNRVAINMAQGKPFLGKNLLPQRFAYFSLEMGLVDIKYFLSKQCEGMTAEELDILEQNFRIFPLGEPLYLNNTKVKREVEAIIKGEGFDGAFFDSMGSTTEDDLSKADVAKPLMDWNDHVRQELNIWTFWIHHHRKAVAGNKKPNKLSDVYGNQVITARATTVVCMWGVQGQDIEILPLKVRLADYKSNKPFMVRRDSRLDFHIKAGVQIISESKEGKTADVIPITQAKSQISLEF